MVITYFNLISVRPAYPGGARGAGRCNRLGGLEAAAELSPSTTVWRLLFVLIHWGFGGCRFIGAWCHGVVGIGQSCCLLLVVAACQHDVVAGFARAGRPVTDFVAVFAGIGVDGEAVVAAFLW